MVHPLAWNALTWLPSQFPEFEAGPEDLSMHRRYALWAGHFYGRHGQDATTFVVLGATIPEEGRWRPLLTTEQDMGGPGQMSLGPNGPVFMTASGVVHDYGWSWYPSFSVDEESGEITLKTSPGDGALVTSTPSHRTDWPSLLTRNGLERVDPK